MNPMARLRSEFLTGIVERGYMHQCTDLAALDALATDGRVIAYVGYDCTGPSLHVGHLLSIMMLRRLQQSGHKPIVLMGGGTTKVGDPSGRDTTRQLLTDADIAGNMASIRRIFARFIEFGDGDGDAIMVNNADWLDKLEYIPFLRDFGSHFSVNRMLGFDSVKLRLEREHPLSFLEFNYMILQAYDFLELSRRHGCVLQMGGSDQWGNIVNGIELTRRVDNREIYGLTAPLLTTSSGAKMGKTAEGAVWLNADELSPYDYWQYWRNTDDADVGRFLRLFTELPLDEIARLETLEGQELNDAKKTLATEATRLCHGEAAAAEAEETARHTFEQGRLGADLPTIEVQQAEIDDGIPVYEALVRAGLCASNSEARRLIKGGGARINDVTVAEEQRRLAADDINPEGLVKLSAGKKRHAVLRPV